MIPFKIFIAVFGVFLVDFGVECRKTRVIKDQIATATSQSDHHEITRQPTHQQRSATSSYEDYNRSKIASSSSSSSSSSRQNTDQPRLTQNKSQREEKRYTTIIRNGQSGSSTESPRSTRPLSFQIGSQNQRPRRQRRPSRLRVRQNNQSKETKDEPREYSRPTFDRSNNRNNSPSKPNSYSFANSNIYINNGNKDSSDPPETGPKPQNIWKPTDSTNRYSSATLITLSTPPTTPKKIISNKDDNDESDLEVHRLRLLFKRLGEQEKNSNLESTTSRYTSSYSKVSMTQSSETAVPKYVRPSKGSASISSTLRPVFSSTVKSTTIKPKLKTTSENPTTKNYTLSEDKLETSTFQPSASAPQSINISAYTPTTESTEVLHTTAAPIHVINITTIKSTTTTTAAPIENTNYGITKFGGLSNFTIPDIYKNAPVSPARLATLGNFNLQGIGGSQQQQKHFQPQTPSLLSGYSSQGGFSNLFGGGSLPGLGGFGNFGSLLSDSSSHSTDTLGKSSGSSGGSSIDFGSDTSNFEGSNLFGGGLGSLSSLGITPGLFGSSSSTQTKSNGVGDLDYLSILSSLGGLSGFGGLGGGSGIQGGLGGLFGLGGTGGLSQQSTSSPSYSLSSLGLGGNIGHQNQSPTSSSGFNILPNFPNVNLGGIGGLSSFPSLTGASKTGNNPGNIPSLPSAGFPSLSSISSTSSVGNIPASLSPVNNLPGTQELALYPKAVVTSVSDSISVLGETVKT